MSIKGFIIKNFFLREIYFLISGKKLNRSKIERKIKKSSNYCKKVKKVSNLIVSLTSYGERIPELKYTLYSLVQQTIQPEKIVVWIAENDIGFITHELRNFEKFGVEFKTTENLKSYTKLIPALMQFPDSYIVTCDDDIFYNPNWLKKMWQEHLRNPDCIISHIAHRISFDKFNNLLPYNKWNHNIYKTRAPLEGFPTGVGGILYQRSLLYRDVTNEALFMRLCPKADDVWFYFMEVLKNVKIKIVSSPYNHLKYVDIYKEYGLNNKYSLQSENVNQNLNDNQIRNVMNYYNISDQDLYNIIYSK